MQNNLGHPVNTMGQQHYDAVVIGAGIVGIAAAYHLSERGVTDVAMVDPNAPMTLTSAKSGENYRDWWPQPELGALAGRSIELMEDIARTTNNQPQLTRRGYAYVTRTEDVDRFLTQLAAVYKDHKLRVHDSATATHYTREPTEGWESAPGGVDVLTHQTLIRQHFPHLDPHVRAVVHVRRAGDLSGQQLGDYMLQAVRAKGGRLIRDEVCGISETPLGFRLALASSHELAAPVVINAAGPFARKIAGMLDVDLPLISVAQQKIAFPDRENTIPRDLPMTIDIDPQTIDWTDDERDALREDPSLRWLTEPMPGGIHRRPDGGLTGQWVKLGWAYNQEPCEPEWESPLTDIFPEVVIRGAAGLMPSLKAYYQTIPRPHNHYGGYYTKTTDNWPLIGPMGDNGAFVAAGLSGYGTMTACAVGELVAMWACGKDIPEYGHALSSYRYEDNALMARIAGYESGEL